MSNGTCGESLAHALTFRRLEERLVSMRGMSIRLHWATCQQWPGFQIPADVKQVLSNLTAFGDASEKAPNGLKKLNERFQYIFNAK